MQEVLTESAIAREEYLIILVGALTQIGGVPWPVSKEIGITIGNAVVPVKLIASHL